LSLAGERGATAQSDVCEEQNLNPPPHGSAQGDGRLRGTAR